MKGGRRQGRQRKRWEDNIREWTGLEFAKYQRAVENREKWRKLVAKSCGAAITLAVKGLMMVMMMMMCIVSFFKNWNEINTSVLSLFQLKELYTLLNENYVEDDDNMFRFDYSPAFLQW